MRLAPLTTLRLGGPAGAADRGPQRGRAGRRGARRRRTRTCRWIERRDRRRGRARHGACWCARAGSCATDELLVVQAGEPWDERRRALRGRGPAGLRVPVRASPARPARRRSRTSAPTARTSRRRSRGCGSMTARPARSRDGRRRVRLRLPPQRLQVPRPLDRARGRVPARASPGSRPAALRRARPRARRAGRRPRAAGRRCARRCSALRRGKGMVIDPADPDSVSAGSFFTNPILTRRGGRRSRRRPPSRAGRADQDLRGLADRAGRLRRGTGRTSRDLDQAHARAGQPRRGHDGRVDGAGARDRGRRARPRSASRWCPSRCSSATHGELQDLRTLRAVLG